MEQRTVAMLATHFHAIDGQLAHVALIHVAHKLADVEFRVLLAVAGTLDHFPKKQRRDADEQPEKYGFYS